MNTSNECDGWLENCLALIFFWQGWFALKNEANVTATVNSLEEICDDRYYYTMRALRSSVAHLRFITADAISLTDEAFEAMKVVDEAEKEMKISESTFESSKANKKSTGSPSSIDPLFF